MIEISLIEQVAQMGLVRQWDAKNLQDFIGGAFQFHIIIDNRHKTVGYDSNSNLDADGILCGALKPLDLKMLFHPFEEELDQPSFLV